MRILILLLAVLGLCAGNATCDTLVERSGRELSGSLVGVQDSILVFRTDAGDTTRIARSAVERVTFFAPVHGHLGTVQLDRSGRVELVVFGTGYGILNGALLASIADFGVDGFTLSMLAGGAAGLYAPLEWSKTRPVSDARASLISFAGSWGMWQGIGWTNALVDEPSADAAITAGLLTGGAGILATAALTGQHRISSGDATFITTAPAWSSAYWLWVMVLTGTENGRFVLGTTLAAGDIGVAAGVLLADRIEASQGRVRLANLGGIVGGLVGGAAVALTNVDSPKLGVSVVMTAATLGLGAGWHLTRNYDRVDAAVSRLEVAPLLVAGNRPVRGLQAAYSF
ncbi:MAG TPA: hypothetical protein PKN69_01905 [Candidatus Latescibacteria bacterium]|nr:hypothetical protein [Candidatus Latescibacterota bacterium]